MSADSQSAPHSWWLGNTTGNKRVHRAECRYARKPYKFADQFQTVESFVDALYATGAHEWHRFCNYCCADAVAYERREYLNAV